MHRWLMVIATALLLLSVAFAEPSRAIVTHQGGPLQRPAASAVVLEQAGVPAAGVNLIGQGQPDGALRPIAFCM